MDSNNKPTIFWDPDTRQLMISGPLPATPDSLRAGGYRFVSGDCETVKNGCIWLWSNATNRRWYLALVKDDVVIASALCFSSSALAEVVGQFEVVGGVL